MKRLVGIALAAATTAALAGCSEKAKEAKEAAAAMQASAGAAENIKTSMDEAQKFYADRKAKGDTIAMEYKALEEYLPKDIAGYKPEGGPTGNKTSMQGFSMTTAEQSYVSTGGDANSPARIKVTLADYGGTEGAYGVASLPLAFAMSSEDDHHRMGSKKFDIPYTAGIEEYNKDNKDAKVSVGSRYRYWVVVEASNQKDDQSAMVSSIAADVAKKLSDK
jgi:type II secretory pathway pseudopilin PulG